jgi:3-deoxy-D-manno-octulosonic-acid transferase
MMRRVYTVLIYCAVPFAFAVVLWRGLRDRGYRHGMGERFGWGRSLTGAPSIWLHAVSLGEMSAAAPLVRALRSRYPKNPLVLTTATPTGRARAQNLFGDADVRFLPYDTPGAVARFLGRVRPQLAVIMETELWPNLFAECKRRGVPLVLASARVTPKSVARYQRFGTLFRGLFSAISLLASQTPGDAERFVSIGARRARTHVIGNIKFDMEVSPQTVAQGRALRATMGARPTWIAGSTHAGEEEQVLAAHEELRRGRPEALLLLVPRHPDRFESVAELLGRRGLAFIRRSSGNAPGDAPVMLVDTVGELAALYASADAAFVGGSLVPVGGHNLLEPAALGLPVLTGPYHSNSRDIARLMIEQGAALEVADARELAAALTRFFADPGLRQRTGAIGRQIVESNRGSVSRLLALIEPLV